MSAKFKVAADGGAVAISYDGDADGENSVKLSIMLSELAQELFNKGEIVEGEGKYKYSFELPGKLKMSMDSDQDGAPSVKLDIDLAEALAANRNHKIIGIRPGEKLHETMCPADDSHLTLEFKDYYLISPTISFVHDVDYRESFSGEKGHYVNQGFEYNSGTNKDFLSKEQLMELCRD